MESDTIQVVSNTLKDGANDLADVSDANSTLANVLGVSLDEHLAVEFADCPNLIPKIQNDIASKNNLFSNTVELGLVVDDVLQQILSGLRLGSTTASVSQQQSNSMGTLFNDPQIDGVEGSKSHLILQYLSGAQKRCDGLISAINCSTSDKTLLEVCKTRINVSLILFLRGLTISGVSHDEIVTLVTKQLLKNQFDTPNLLKTICAFVEDDVVDSSALAEVFNPIFSKLRCWLTMININDKFNMFTELLLKSVHYLLSLQINGKRPLADLLVSRDDFAPNPISDGAGREFVRTSFLGPILSTSTVGHEDDETYVKTAEKFFPDIKLWRDPQRSLLYSGFQSRINSLRSEMHGILHILLVNTTSRAKTLNYLARVLDLNRKRTQIHANRSKLASNGVMLNVLSVMLQLSERIMLDKVQDYYIFHPEHRIDVEDEARISFPPETVAKIQSEIDVNFEPKFTTECFYLTIFAMNVGMNASVEHLGQLKSHLREVRQAVNDLQELIKRKGDAYAKNPIVVSRIKHVKDMEKRLILNHMCNECVLKDENLILRCVKFANQQLALVLRSVSADLVRNMLPESPPNIFGTLPEIFIESALDFMVFSLREAPNIFMLNSENIAEHLLVLSCCLHFFKNPYLASKVVNVVFMVSPMVNPGVENIFRRIVDNAFAAQRLFASLSKFYADVESTGANSEFYDKFNIRRSIQVIFKCMWHYPIHRNSMVEVAGKHSPEFIRFINMVINDTTFLLDESLTGLRKIRDIETLMENEAEFNALSEEDRNQKRSALNEVKRSVRTWMILCNDTLEFFILLTTDNPRIFYNTLGERVAAMLNYNVVQLCGPKCAELKVKDAKSRFEWDPRKLLQQIVNIYLNLSSEEFAEDIAQDERSYTPEAFSAILEKITQRRILEMCHTERFRNLMEMAERHYREKAQQEMDFGDDIPNEFLDELVYTLMSDPMRLPSGQVVDKKHIVRHLLSDKTNPFTRQPLTMEELTPDTDLKHRIEEWVAEKKRNARK